MCQGVGRTAGHPPPSPHPRAVTHRADQEVRDTDFLPAVVLPADVNLAQGVFVITTFACLAFTIDVLLNIPGNELMVVSFRSAEDVM